MADNPDALEGWGLRWRAAILIAAGFFLLIAVGIVGSLFFYQALGAPHISVRPAESFPSPRLNARLDSDPHWSFAPPNPEERGPDPAVRRAMAELAARGDSGYQPLRASP